jgi:feruloyl esterase
MTRISKPGVLAVVALGLAPAADAANICEDLGLLSLPETVIRVAERVSSGTFTPPGNDDGFEVPALCRVAGTVAPAIQFEVWLPEGDGYNGRFQAVGGGGLAGVISYSAMATAVRDGYASASTDTGHVSTDTSWQYDVQRRTDYGYRAIHEMTVKAKAIIDAHYGRAPEYSYFNGCSTGGRQGLMEAQRFPGDYDGIVSGAPVNTFTNLHIGQLWTAHATLKKPGAVLTEDDLSLVSQTVLAQCDALDGVEDGVLADPRRCEFDPRVLQCVSGNSGSCLAEPKIEALEMIYQGAQNPRTGTQIYPGLEPGSEAPQPRNRGWQLIMNGEGPFNIDEAVIGHMAFGDPDWDWTMFDFDRDVDAVNGKLFGVLNAVNPDMRPFKQQGGKLIVWHGWNDPGVMPQRTVDFHDEIIGFAAKAERTDGRAYTDEYLKLYMLPGVGHCRGGNGPDQVDWMDAISAWVEDGEEPAALEAELVEDGNVTMARPICPHPQAARYRGRGDTNDARNFECR